MENRKYNVARDQVYVGQVVKSSHVYRITDGFSKEENGKLSVGCWRPSRSILFVPDENKHANDLLYNSPRYIALNVSPDEEGLNVAADTILVKDSVSLALLLKYFEYPEILTYKDIVNIRKTFFTGRFAMDHCELFGFKETQAEDVTFYEWGEPVTDPRRLAKRRREFRREQAAGRRMFTGINEAVLPREYWDALDDLGEIRDFDYVNLSCGFDPFKPTKVEGPIKKLKRF